MDLPIGFALLQTNLSMRASILLLCVMPWAAQADTIHFCKSYAGGMFWSSVPCGQRQATVERMVDVPDDLSWRQKVALGEAARAQGEAVANRRPGAPLPLAQAKRHAECAHIRSSISDLEAKIKLRRTGRPTERQGDQLEKLETRRQALQC